LFGGSIPLIAIQMSALQIGEQVALLFTKVLDELPLGLVDEDEEVQETADRAYWESRATKATVAMADELLEIIRTFDSGLDMKYNKFYIGLAKGDRPNNFAIFRPRKSNMRLEFRLDPSEELEQQLEEAGLDVMEYNRRPKRYRLRLTESDFEEHRELVTDLLKRAYANSNV